MTNNLVLEMINGVRTKVKKNALKCALADDDSYRTIRNAYHPICFIPPTENDLNTIIKLISNAIGEYIDLEIQFCNNIRDDVCYMRIHTPQTDSTFNAINNYLTRIAIVENVTENYRAIEILREQKNIFCPAVKNKIETTCVGQFTRNIHLGGKAMYKEFMYLYNKIEQSERT